MILRLAIIDEITPNEEIYKTMLNALKGDWDLVQKYLLGWLKLRQLHFLVVFYNGK